MVIELTVAVNVPVVAPEATVTLPGTVVFVLLLESVTGNPPVGAEPLSVAVQVEEPGAFTLPGVQLTLLSIIGGGSGVIVIVDPTPDAGIPVPAAFEDTTPFSATGTLVVAIPAAVVKVAAAIEPFPIAVLFIPKATQVVTPLVVEQLTLLPAAVAAGPGMTETANMSAGE